MSRLRRIETLERIFFTTTNLAAGNRSFSEDERDLLLRFLAGLRDVPIVKIGFAAETDDLLANARQKLAAKGLAMIVANDAVATIGARDSTATFLYADGRVEEQPNLAKESLADRICDQLVVLLGEQPAASSQRSAFSDRR